jgi:malonyl CoA-acyl carrier protein transacylase
MTKVGSLQYPIISSIKLSKIYDADEEKNLLDQELYTTIQWQKACELIKEYQYDLIIDLGPGDAMTNLLNSSTSDVFNSPIITLSRYNSCFGLFTAVEKALND